jgi:hypothetical protein
MSVLNILIYIAYFLFVILIVTFFSWSTVVLQRQKKAWHVFATRHDLVYHNARLMQAAAVEGNYKGYRIGLFSEGRVEEQRRGFIRFRTVIEVIFGESMPIRGALGNTDAAPVISYLNYGTNHIAEEQPNWDKNHIITASNHTFIKEYLTPMRMKGLNNFFNMKNTTAMFVFNEKDSFLRLETSNPMIEADKIESLINKMVHLANVLKLEKTEIPVQPAQEPPVQSEEAIAQEIPPAPDPHTKEE